MKRTFHSLYCLIVAGVCAFSASHSLANTVEVDWDSIDGFAPDPVTINAGDTIDFVNLDETFDLQLTGNPPEAYTADLPASDGITVYYVPVDYSSPGTYTASDEFGDVETIFVNSTTPLSVAITSPTNGTVFTAPASFTVTATPAGGSGSYNDVQIFVGSNSIADVFSAPYSATAANLPVGNYVISAIATDTAFNTASNSIAVTVGSPIFTNNILPVACADIYSSGNVDYGLYLDADVNDHGTLEFAEFNASQYNSILLEVNPYGLPLFGPVVSVYGFDGGNGTLYSSNFNSGTLIGQWTLPTGLNYGQIATFDVTSFVKSTKGPYFGIYLAAGGDLFSSTTKNYGTPPMLYAVGPLLLNATRTSNQMIVNWTTNAPAGFTLQASTNMGPSAAWNPVVQSPSVVGTQWVVTNPISGPSAFFRLSSP